MQPLPSLRTLLRVGVLLLFAALLSPGTRLMAGPLQDAPAYQTFLVQVNRFPSPPLIDVAAGRESTCAVDAGGGVWCWGHNGVGQLGDGTSGDSAHRNRPVRVAGLESGVRAVTTGGDHACALTTAGGVKCWGANWQGQLGDGTMENRLTPVDVVGLSDEVSAITAGGSHTCALTSAGGVQCWGHNWWGQLGDGSSADRQLTPVAVAGLGSGVTAISAGSLHTCALTEKGGVTCWGDREYGQLGDNRAEPAAASRVPVAVHGLASGVTAIDAGIFHTCAVTPDGALCWGHNWYGQLGDGAGGEGRYQSTPVAVAGLTGSLRSIYAGFSHTCALTTAGSLTCWGNNGYGQLGDGTLTNRLAPGDAVNLRPAVRTAALGGGHTCAVTRMGGLQCWGINSVGQLGRGTGIYGDPRTMPAHVEGLAHDVVALASGWGHTCALDTDGGALCWGWNQYGQLGDGSTDTRSVAQSVTGLEEDVHALVAGGSHTCALTAWTEEEGGGVKCWGHNWAGQLGDGTLGDQNYRTTPAGVVGLTHSVRAITANGNHTCALTMAGGVKCWGYNLSGQLGDGTMGDANSRSTPVDVVGLSSGVTAIAAGLNHTCALIGGEDETGGGVRCWGSNIYGELGNGSAVASPKPVDVAGLASGVRALAAGGGQTCALMVNGEMRCWGYNEFGQVGDGSTADRRTPGAVAGLSHGVEAVVARGGHTCVRTAAGADTNGVYCWGKNWTGELGDGTRLDRYTPVAVVGLSSPIGAIAAGSAHICAVTALQAGAGRVQCWGSNVYGQLGVDPGWRPGDVVWP